MKNILIFFLLLIGLKCFGQQTGKYNLGFENQRNENGLADGWIEWGYYDLSIDSLAHSGQKSGKITADKDGNSFGSIAYNIPANYTGNTITLEGYMKIKDVENGHAGLILRVDGNGTSLAFDNMQDEKITGTKDWSKYKITLDYPEKAESIFIGGILSGKGEAWFDDFQVSLDGENIQVLEEVERELSKADKDKEFDQGSNIEIPELTPERIESLEVLGKVWGFLKYYHPAISKGNYNWDYELFRFLPGYLNAKNVDKRNSLLIDWIDSIGEIENCSDCLTTDENAFLKPDFKWLDAIENNLKNKLMYVYNNRNQGEHYYIGRAPAGNPDFKNEDRYEENSFPDAGFRILSLYRYWNMIHYFFPYKYLTDKDWSEVLKEYIPVFLNAENELEYELAALQIIADVKDTHANLWEGSDKVHKWKGSCYPPVHVQFIENKLVVTDYYNQDLKEETGLDIGDIITEINGKTIDQIIKEKSKYYPASNEPTRLRNLSADILRSNTPEVTIKYNTESSEEQKMKLPLYPREKLGMSKWYKKDNGETFEIIENNIGYVTLETIQGKDISQIKKDFKNTDGIIIDIRNYPSTFVPFTLGSYFVSNSTPFAKFTRTNINNPGEFTFSDYVEIPPGNEKYDGKLIVLVNEDSQSQAEYTAMAFKAVENSTIIGSTTAGADGNVSSILLPGGLRTIISGIGVYYPDGGETQRKGIVSDVEIKPTIEGIREGRDEVLEKAIEMIKNK